MSVAERRKLTTAAYLAVERKAETKSEFLDGEVFSMAGGTQRHSLIATNLASKVRAGLEGGSWLLRAYDKKEDVLVLDSVGCRVPLAEIFANTEPAPAK